MKTAVADSCRDRRNADRGAVLMVVLIVMVALLGLGMTGLFLTSGSIQMNSNINMRNQALVVAEAGIERAQAILNNPFVAPNLPALLAPTVSNPADEPIQNANQCQGERRGAVLREAGMPLVDIVYQPVSRTSDLPAAGGTSGAAAVLAASMGRYTVYVRQDTRDCRMGNYACDLSPSMDAGIEVCTTPPPVGVPPNGVVVVRSEGVASDGKTRVVLEVTMSPSLGMSMGPGNPLAALCASGANGCDDNASVQSGIVVTSGGPSLGGASGSGAGGIGGGGGGAGGIGGAVGGSTGVMPGAGGAGGGGVSGMPGAGGAGGGGAGGSTGCVPKHRARVAIIGEWGLWNAYVTNARNDSGSALFRQWLDENFGTCQPIGKIDGRQFGGGRLRKEHLEPYNVIIALDLFHSNIDRWNCLSQWNNGCQSSYFDGRNYCYGPVAGFPRLCPNILCNTCPPGSTSYMVGTQPILTTGEVKVITDWLAAGNGLVTTMGYYYTAPQTENANKILNQIGLSYKTNGDGTVPKALESANGVDLCADPACPGGGDFLRSDGTTPGRAPFEFKNSVNRLQIRGAVPIITLPSPPIPATLKLAAKVQCVRQIATNDRCNANPPASCDSWSAATQPSGWQDVGYTAENIGAGGGRVVAWGDEWLTYNTLWGAWKHDVYADPPLTPCPTSPPYQAAEFWENVIAWLAVNHPM